MTRVRLPSPEEAEREGGRLARQRRGPVMKKGGVAVYRAEQASFSFGVKEDLRRFKRATRIGDVLFSIFLVVIVKQAWESDGTWIIAAWAIAIGALVVRGPEPSLVTAEVRGGALTLCDLYGNRWVVRVENIHRLSFGSGRASEPDEQVIRWGQDFGAVRADNRRRSRFVVLSGVADGEELVRRFAIPLATPSAADSVVDDLNMWRQSARMAAGGSLSRT
jgi:hypothetical protein